MKGLASVVALLFTVLLLVSGFILLSVYVTNKSIISQKEEFRSRILSTVGEDYLRIDGASLEGNTLVVTFTALQTVDLNKVSIFLNHRYVGSCEELSCADQTGNGVLIPGESGKVQIPSPSNCSIVVTLEYSGTTAQRSFDLCVWSCRRTITISSSFSEANYPVRILLTSADFNFSKSDGNDVRFTEEDGTKIPYWIEYWTSSEAVIWIKTDVVSGDKNVYMYYCNPYASSESNGHEVFTYFDFNDTNLLAVFHFDEGSGSKVYDVFGRYEGNLVGDVSWASGRYGSSLYFDGNGDYVEINFAESYQELTYMVFVMAETPDGDVGKVLHDGSWSRTIGVGKGLNPYIHFDTNGNNYLYDYSTTVSGDWYHVAARVSGRSSFQEIYVNGELKNSSSIDGLPSRYENLFLGAEGGTNYYYKGYIDEVVLFGRLLSPEEINLLSSGYFDFLTSVWVVRKRVDPEPTVTIGQEETGSWKLN